MNNLSVGIDIGGTHITAALVHMGSRSIIKDSYFRKHVNSKGSAEEIIAAWCGVINQVRSFNAMDDLYIGMAMPGPFDYENGISYISDLDKYESLYGLNVKNRIAHQLGINSSQIKMLNDAACFLQGEAFAGAAAGYENAIGLTLGTGVGTAIYKNGSAEDAQLWCSPFLGGITEDYLSTKWFLKRYHQISGLRIANVKELAEIHHTSAAQMVFEEFAFNLGTFIGQFILLEQPQAVVLGGNIMNAEHIFLPYLQKHLRHNNINTPIHLAKLNEEAAILGAASLWSSKDAARRYIPE